MTNSKTPLPPKALSLPFAYERPAPRFEGNDIRYPESLARYFIRQFTKKGDRVFDPFAGLGTTLFVAEELQRTPFGIEAEPTRHAYVAGQLQNWQNLICGDSANLQQYGLPKMDFCVTSPPFMAKNQKWNPLHAGNPKHAGYTKYLSQMSYIFAQIAQQMKKGAYVVVQVDNIDGPVFTPLVSDFQQIIAASLAPAGHTVINWQPPAPAHYPHTHALVFRRK